MKSKKLKAGNTKKTMAANIKPQNEVCEYCHDKVDDLLDSTPRFTFFYHLMTIAVYLGILFIVWFFVYYAYSIDTPIYDLLCIKCGVITRTVIKSLITFWLFALYFYFLAELRCRAWDMNIFVMDTSVQKTNKWILALSFLFAGLTSVFIWF